MNYCQTVSERQLISEYTKIFTDESLKLFFFDGDTFVVLNERKTEMSLMSGVGKCRTGK